MSVVVSSFSNPGALLTDLTSAAAAAAAAAAEMSDSDSDSDLAELREEGEEEEEEDQGEGFQSSLFSNQYLPYYATLKQEAAALLEDIKVNLSIAVQKQELWPGALYWTNRLSRWVNGRDLHLRILISDLGS